MPTGTEGSTLCAELNRLANGGTYPARTAFLDEQGAANTWAGTSGLGIIGALNQKASAGRAPSAYKDLNGICNELAGTTGKSAVDALRTIAS
jgi:hypothetical protein